MEGWKLGDKPRPYEIRSKNARYAVLLVMGGDDAKMNPQLYGDFWEMSKGVSEDVAVLALVDYLGEGRSRVMEMRPRSADPVEQLSEICTGDPRPVADFLARGLVSFGAETRFAIGFWGHGNGVFEDFDSAEIALDRGLRFGPLGGGGLWELFCSPRERSMLPDETSGNALTNREASSALAAAFCRTRRTEPVDLLFFDTCLNGSVEVYAELERFARVFVASSLLIDGPGWHYELWLRITGERMPETAEEWAHLAVKAYDVTYAEAEEPAHLVATRCGVGLVEAFAELVGVLGTSAGARGAGSGELVLEAARRARSVFYDENLDLREMVRGIRELAEADGLEEVREAAERFLQAQEEALVSESSENPGAVGLCGMTVWCPFLGDRSSVGRYYEGLEFERVTGWGRLWSESGLGKRAL